MQIIASTISGAGLWVLLLTLTGVSADAGDLVCGALILLCAFWCNYWVGNLAGGFRAQMILNLAAQQEPVSLEKWMAEFGGQGMDEFLRDRARSILVPWGLASLDEERMVLLPGRGFLMGRLLNLLKWLLPGLRDGR